MRPVTVPPVVVDAMQRGAALAISISGGKDSQALLAALVSEYRRRSWIGRIYAVHANLGRAEWPQTLAHCRNLCARYGVELIEVARPQGDLLQQIQDRAAKLDGTGKVPWPDARNRYCTSDQKRSQIDKVIRRDSLVVSAMGMRAQESAARSRRSVVSVAKRLSAKAIETLTPRAALSAVKDGQRLVLDWLPLHEWTEDDIWVACGHSISDLARRQALYREGNTDAALTNWSAHPAYVMGNQRLSCSLCILGSRGDLVNGARNNPELYREYVAIERATGFTFRQDVALADLNLDTTSAGSGAALASCQMRLW